jgi:hypothetical protein
MKRFIFSILAVSVFFTGVGALLEKAGARFKSDEKALALIQQARQALGGDSAINSVQSLRIVGQTTRTLNINGTSKTIQGETEIAMQLPDKVMKMMKIGHDDGTPGDKMVQRQVDVVVVNGDKAGKEVSLTTDGDAPAGAVKRIVIKRPDGTTEELSGADAERVIVRDGDLDKRAAGEPGKDGERQIVIRKSEAEAHEKMKHNELLRLTLGLLLTAPQGLDVNYTFGGESDVDGTACNIVVADVGGSAYKIYLGKSSNLPVMMTFTGMRMPNVMFFKKEGGAADTDSKDKMVFTRTVDGPAAETAEFQVKFSDYRAVNGVQLPYKWTQSVGGTADEVFDVTSYEVNPANIAEKFQHQKVMLRTTKPE